MHYVCERVGARKLCGFLICSHLKGSAFTAVRRDTKFKTRYVKGVPFINRRQTKRGTVKVTNAIFDHKCSKNWPQM